MCKIQRAIIGDPKRGLITEIAQVGRVYMLVKSTY